MYTQCLKSGEKSVKNNVWTEICGWCEVARKKGTRKITGMVKNSEDDDIGKDGRMNWRKTSEDFEKESPGCKIRMREIDEVIKSTKPWA